MLPDALPPAVSIGRFHWLIFPTFRSNLGSTIHLRTAIERGGGARANVRLGVERAKMLARASRCHLGVLVFPGWQLPEEAAA